jgi:hypothetical protein
LGSTVVTTDDFGHALFDVSLSVVANGDDLITATATEAGGSTSEFSFGVTVASVDPPAPEPEPVLSVEEQIAATLDSINEFVSTGVLNQRAGKAVSMTLNNALKQLEKGNTNSATNMLEASANKVRALVRSGRLSTDDGQALLDQLDEVVDELLGETSGEFSTLDTVFSGNKVGKMLHRV